MVRARRVARIVDVMVAPAQHADAVVRGIVLQASPSCPTSKLRRQRLQRADHVAEVGGAAFLRHFHGIEDARCGRVFDIGHVRVPSRLGSAQSADRTTVDDDVRDRGQIGIGEFREFFLGDPPVWRIFEGTKAAAEVHQGFVVETLTANAQYRPIQPRRVDRGKLRISQRREVHIDYVHAKGSVGEWHAAHER